MGHQPCHVVAGLGLDLVRQQMLRICGAGEEEVLPHHQAQLVARLVEGVVLVDAAAPHTDHVDVRRLGLRAGGRGNAAL